MLTHDLKPQPDGSLSEAQIAALIHDIRYEPQWRENAAIEEELYDGNQLSQDVLIAQRENGIPSIIVNLIQPVIKAVTGFETMNRTDPIVLPEDDESVPGAEALNQDLKEIVRITGFNDAFSEAFMSAAKIGIGWVEISRHADPFAYPYRAEYVPWREMWWDWRARKKDLSDARYILRRKWYDRDVLATMLPQHRATIESATSSWPTGAPGDWDTAEVNVLRPMGRSLEYGSSYQSTEQYEWLDPDSRRIAMFEILYRVPYAATVMRFPDGRVIEFDPQNRFHDAAVRSERVELRSGPSTRMRQAFYIGPTRLTDVPIASREYHYVPVVMDLEGGDGTPYGFVRHMRSPQESYNARYSRVLHDLSARRVILSEDAVENHEQTAREVNRADAYIRLRTARAPNSVFEILANTDASAETFRLLETSRSDIEAATGLFSTFQGQPTSPHQSGAAIERLQHHGKQVLGTFFQNFNHARRRAATLLMEMRVTDLRRMDDVAVRIDRTGARDTRTIVLNRLTHDGTRENDVVMLRTRVVLAETPTTQTYRQQKAMQLTEAMKAMPPELQALMTDIYVDTLDVPHSREIIDRIREMTGFGPKSEDPEIRATQDRKEAEEAEMSARMRAVEIAEREARVAQIRADAMLTEVKAKKLAEADWRLTEAKVLSEIAKAVDSENEQERKDLAIERDLIESSARLAQEARQQARNTTDAE